MTELAKTYRPAEVEPQSAKKWDAARAFHAEASAMGKSFGMVIPPPNVTSALHLGHALNNTLQDIMARYHRMAGDNTMWMPGTDHAGIATQTVVDKRLAQDGQPTLKDYKKLEAEGKGGREQFIEKVQAWKDEYEKRITDQLVAMGCSCDWERQRFTMDEVCAAAVREAFFQLFKDGLIYRGKRLVNWDPVTQTALADDEVEMQEVDGHFWYMKYPVVEKRGDQWEPTGEKATVATTRPETMLGDTAVAVNPKDAPRASLIGKHVKLPIVGRIIPIIADDYVVIPDPDSADSKARMASGFLKVTPAHDSNDYEIGQRHSLAVINVMAPDASISLDHGWKATDPPSEEDLENIKPLLGLSREEARKYVVRHFKDNDLLADQKPYRHSVGHSYRSHVPVEPYLSDQWYVKVTDDRLAGAALKAMTPKQRSKSEGCTWTESHPFEQIQTTTSRDRQGAVSPRSYFISFTTYGNWLRGDDRGSVDRNKNLPGESFILGDEGREQAEFHRLKQPPMSLEEETRRVVQQTIFEVCEHRGWQPHAIHVRPEHVHVVITADHGPERVMNDFKSYATRRLREAGLVGADRRVWTRHGSTRYINDETYLANAIRYVVEKQGAAMEPAPFDERVMGEGKPLPYGRGSLDSENEPRTSASGSSWEGQLRFYPDRYAKTFQTWHENIRDWCISRQLWWGHRIPVWYVRFDTTAVALDLNKPDESGRELEDRLNRYGASVGLKDAFSVRFETDPLNCVVCTRSADADEAFRKMLSVRAGLQPAGYDRDAEREQFASHQSHGFARDCRHQILSATQDPDVLDTWFSSALWPISTLGWPRPEHFPEQFPDGDAALNTWNPGNVLCTAREIITLWVSRMVMFNLYFRDRLPFTDVVIHAMIQDGHGQKMSKSLGNGVDPFDIIHTHGADAMRFTLASMATQTQDVRLPVDVLDPTTGEAFTPKYITTSSGHKVAAPLQEHNGKKMASSFGLASGQAKPTDELPLARNTSGKFDLGRNFANKLWNAVRFALEHLSSEEALAATDTTTGLADRWIVSRLIEAVGTATDAIERYDFAGYANALYDFFWRDLCDWYIEAVKPTLRQNKAQQQVLAMCIDGSLRLLHPGMPFVTEALWARLNEVAPDRHASSDNDLLKAVSIPSSELLVTAAWPEVAERAADDVTAAAFERVQQVVGALREVRTTHKVAPRQTVTLSAKASDWVATVLREQAALVGTLANVEVSEVGQQVARPSDAASTALGEAELYLHGLVDREAERERLEKRAGDLNKSIATLNGRLSNESYVSKAPAHLVDQTREQLAAAQRELATIEDQLGALK